MRWAPPRLLYISVTSPPPPPGPPLTSFLFFPSGEVCPISSLKTEDPQTSQRPQVHWWHWGWWLNTHTHTLFSHSCYVFSAANHYLHGYGRSHTPWGIFGYTRGSLQLQYLLGPTPDHCEYLPSSITSTLNIYCMYVMYCIYMYEHGLFAL